MRTNGTVSHATCYRSTLAEEVPKALVSSQPFSLSKVIYGAPVASNSAFKQERRDRMREASSRAESVLGVTMAITQSLRHTVLPAKRMATLCEVRRPTRGSKTAGPARYLTDRHLRISISGSRTRELKSVECTRLRHGPRRFLRECIGTQPRTRILWLDLRRVYQDLAPQQCLQPVATEELWFE